MKAVPLLLATALFSPLHAQEPPPAPDRNRPGPWDNDVLVYRVAPGGDPEKLATFERAGVPTVARLKDGRLLAAHQHFPQNDRSNFDMVAVRFSADEGRTWTAPQVIRVSGLPQGMRFPFDPTLVPLPDGRLRLYFTGNYGRTFQRSTPAIHSAISKDGVDYTYEPGVRFSVEGRVVIDCAAALHEGVFHLIVPDNGEAEEFLRPPSPVGGEGRDEGAGRPVRPPPRREPPGGNGYHALSRDGLKFECVADVKLTSSRNRWLGNLASDAGRLVFFGSGPGPWPVTSADGKNWQPAESATRIPGADPGAVKLRDGSWLLVVTGPPRPGTPSALQRGDRPAPIPADAPNRRPPVRAPQSDAPRDNDPAPAARLLTVNAGEITGRIRSLLGVNRGPLMWPRERGGTTTSLVESYRRFGIDFIRTHDFYGPTDWHVIFPRWDADPADAASYDFRSSDERIRAIVENGFGCFYRLGTSWRGRRLEPLNDPPGTKRDASGRVTRVADRDDFKKWAAICAQTVRHYTEGWNNGFKFPIEYWEVWNEPDLAAQFWTGTPEQYYALYEEAARAVKAVNPKLKVGGPACTGGLREAYVERFIRYCAERKVPLDFFSWHSYGGRDEFNPFQFRRDAERIRRALDAAGFTQAENINTEWNAGIQQRLFSDTPRGAAFYASTLACLLDAGLDRAFQYCGDQHPGLGLHELRTGEPKICAFAFAAWKRLLETPERLAATGGDERGYNVVAAKSADNRRVQVLISDFQSPDRAFRLRVEKLPWAADAKVAVKRWLLDADHRFSVVEESTTSGDEITLERPFRSESVCLIELQVVAIGAAPPAASAPREDDRVSPEANQRRSVEPPPPLSDPGVLVRIPSSAAGVEGVAASVLIPRPPRYTNGAPVVIHVSGGVQAGNARGRPEYVGHGFVEIHFAFPGGGVGEDRSGGTYDFRGSNSVRALADVIRFANGRLADKEGRFIGEIGRGVMVLTNNVGIVGSSHGGNACGLALAKFGDEFPNLGWYASMESPYGEGAANVELGGHETGVNPAYDPKTGALDLSKLAWSPELTPGLFRKPMLVEPRGMKGAFFFDLNGDGRFSRDDDFPANCFVGDAGGGAKAWSSPRVLAEAAKRSLIPGERPAHMPTLAEARGFWSWRDAAPSIPEAVRRCTNLAVIVYANERDHVQADPAHTHILEQVEGFRKAGGRFVRLNPDRAYVERIAPTSPRLERRTTFADNPAGKIWTRTNIAEGLEPSVFAQGPYMQAAVCELADRTQAREWSVNLDAVLFPEAPRPAFPPPRRRPPGAGPRQFNP
jgi:hypothetical protein